jgi:hypothetical protein
LSPLPLRLLNAGLSSLARSVLYGLFVLLAGHYRTLPPASRTPCPSGNSPCRWAVSRMDFRPAGRARQGQAPFRLPNASPGGPTRSPAAEGKRAALDR